MNFFSKKSGCQLSRQSLVDTADEKIENIDDAEGKAEIETSAIANQAVLLSTSPDKATNTTDHDIPFITVKTTATEDPTVSAVGEKIPTTLEVSTISTDGESNLQAKLQEKKKEVSLERNQLITELTKLEDFLQDR
jgi:hypothetical protein